MNPPIIAITITINNFILSIAYQCLPSLSGIACSYSFSASLGKTDVFVPPPLKLPDEGS